MPVPGRLSPAGESTLDGQIHHLCNCWLITLTSGAELYFTDFPRQVELFEDGENPITYEPVGGGNPSARRAENELRGGNFEMRGFLDSNAITTDDLKRGYYEYARVKEMVVDWRVPFQGPIKTKVYFIKSAGRTGYEWSFEMVSLSQILKIPKTELLGPDCVVDLFSQGVGKCNKSNSGFVETVTVQTIINRRTFTVNTTSQASGFWAGGDVYWNTAGSENRFTRQDIKDSYGTDGQTIELQVAPPLSVAIGDSVVVTAGCNKQLGANSATGDCVNKFNNGVNYQGRPYIPGYSRSVRGLLGL